MIKSSISLFLSRIYDMNIITLTIFPDSSDSTIIISTARTILFSHSINKSTDK